MEKKCEDKKEKEIHFGQYYGQLWMTWLIKKLIIYSQLYGLSG